ncbi:MAG: TIGR01777 family oxidoreductase [Pseudomonadota bacterium]
MSYLITGATGFVGKKLIANLLQNQQKIIVLTRSKSKAEKLFGNQVRVIENLTEISNSEKIDHIINLAGEPIADKRWNEKQKEILVNSRIQNTQNIINLISRLEQKPTTLISASAIGFYGSRGDEELDENSSAGQEFTSDLCQKWEKCANQASSFGVRVCLTRFGIVLGKNGGALAKMLPAFKLGLGGKIGDGQQFMSWIDIDDLVAAINFLIQNQNLSGVFNFTAPNPITNQQFTKTLAKTLNRPAFFNMPALAVKILFGQMGEDLLLNGQKVLPKRLLASEFKFVCESLESALRKY